MVIFNKKITTLKEQQRPETTFQEEHTNEREINRYQKKNIQRLSGVRFRRLASKKDTLFRPTLTREGGGNNNPCSSEGMEKNCYCLLLLLLFHFPRPTNTFHCHDRHEGKGGKGRKSSTLFLSLFLLLLLHSEGFRHGRLAVLFGGNLFSGTTI